MNIGNNAIVIGAGIGGISAAGALSKFFKNVTVVDRDILPDSPSFRKGTPQAVHGHGLLAGGQRALNNIFPGLNSLLQKNGAVILNQSKDLRIILPFARRMPQEDLGFNTYAMSRPLLERTLRESLEKIENVTIRSGFEVKTLLYDTLSNTVTGVKGKVENDEETLLAEIVIDASNTGKPTLSILKALGRDIKPDTSIEIDIGYSSAIFEIPENASTEWKAMMQFPSPTEDHCAALIQPIEGNKWQISISGRLVGYPPANGSELVEYVKGFRTPDVYNAIRDARIVSEVSRFRLKESRIRHFGAPKDFPRGLLPLGDSVCKFNPVYGQGMTSAAMQAEVLHSLLDSYFQKENPLDLIRVPYFQKVNELIDTPWIMSAIPDLSYPNVKGDRPPGFDDSQRYNDLIFDIAQKDRSVLKLLFEVTHLLKPRSAFADTDLLERLRNAS